MSIGGHSIIAKAIHDSERKSTLFKDSHSSDFLSLFNNSIFQGGAHFRPTESWLGVLFWLLVEMRDLSQFIGALSDITFISFNYDRCIQHFLSNAAASYYRLESAADVKRVHNAIKVINPYGSLGELAVNDARATGFGEIKPGLVEASARLRTFTEGITGDSISDEIQNAFSKAELVFFMGFGFLNINMDILFRGGPYSVRKVLGTRKGLSDSSAQIVESELKEKLFGAPLSGRPGSVVATRRASVELSDCYCQDLVYQHLHFLRGATKG